MIKIEIKNRWAGKILFECSKENNTIKQTLLAAIAAGSDLRDSDLSGSDLRDSDLRGSNLSGSDLRDSDLSGSDLRGSNLSGSDLRDSDLSGSDLSCSNLRGSDLSDSDLSCSNLRGSNLSDSDLSCSDLTPIKEDLFIVLLHSLPEIKYLKKSIIEGKIDGSTYDGECACLSGTLVNGARKSNGKQEQNVVDSIIKCRSASRPIERFFLGIKIGDTPENSQFSKLALAWIEEFERLIAVQK